MNDCIPRSDAPKAFSKIFPESVCRVLALADKCVYSNYITATITTNGDKKMSKKVTWIVTKDEKEIARVSTKKMAETIASQIGGYIHKYTVE